MRKSANYKKNFVPKELSIGPIHSTSRHGKLKLKLAAYFISESGSTSENILKDFESKMSGIRTCFEEEIIQHYREQDLMRLLFLDGCAILGFILNHMKAGLKVVDISDEKAADIERDLFLLENQIPFQVLGELIGSVRCEEKRFILQTSVIMFIYRISNSHFRRDFSGHIEHLFMHMYDFCFTSDVNNKQKPAHLLDVYREALLFNPHSFDSGYMQTLVGGIFRILSSCGFEAICLMLESFQQESYRTFSWRRTKQFFHSVQELKAAGIKFKRSHSLTTISFHTRFFVAPQLRLPTIIVDDSTGYKLFNLVGYEMCLSESLPDNKPWITSYVNLLDSLVDNEQDIKDLRAADILRKTLSTDALAAELINEVGTGCVAPTVDAYEVVKDKIEKYYRTKCAIWMAQVCDTHFSSPWNILALFAAITVLVLTAVQTWYAVNPRK